MDNDICTQIIDRYYKIKAAMDKIHEPPGTITYPKIPTTEDRSPQKATESDLK